MTWKNTVDNKEANWNRMKTAEKTSIRSQFWNMDNGKHETKFGLVRMPQKQESVSTVSEVVRFFPTTQELQMRGGADTDEERDAPPKPQATLVVFHWVNTVSSQACGSAAARLGAAKRNQELQKKKKKANHKVVVCKSSELMLTAAHQFFGKTGKSLENELITFLQLKALQKTAELVTPRSWFSSLKWEESNYQSRLPPSDLTSALQQNLKVTFESGSDSLSSVHTFPSVP